MAFFNPHQPFALPLLPPQIKSAGLSDPELTRLVIKTHRAIGELNGLQLAMPGISRILMRLPSFREAVSSSAIEGIHTTVETLLEAQATAPTEGDPASKEALRYKQALQSGFDLFKKLKSLSTRVILDIHSKLMLTGGRFKTQENKIARSGHVVYTPPALTHISALMSNWERYVHSDERGADPLIKAAISHYQFEAIHPFSDGNGRTGRIALVLQLALYKLLDFPILHISGYLMRRRSEYCALLLEISRKESWIPFIKFMIRGFYEQALSTRKVIMDIAEERRKMKRVLKEKLSAALYSQDFLDHLFAYPVTYPSFMAKKLGIAYQTASRRLSLLEKAGLLSRKRAMTYVLYYNFRLLQRLQQGMDEGPR